MRGWFSRLHPSTLQVLALAALGVSLLAGAALADTALPGTPLALVASGTEATVSATTVTAPIGSWTLALTQWLNTYVAPGAVTLAAGALTAGIARTAPVAGLFLSQKRVEQMLQAGLTYGLNAVAGAAKGKTLDVNVGSAVLKKGVDYLLAESPALVVRLAGGPDGIAKRLFRLLDLDEAANENRVLTPVLDDLRRQGLSAGKKRRAA